MSIESTLTRELEIRFIDARAIATEAKLNLGMEGYVDDCNREELVIKEAIRVFQRRSIHEQISMRQLHTKLTSIKSSMAVSSGHSSTCSGDDLSSSLDLSFEDNLSARTSSTKGSRRRTSRRRGSGDGIKRRSSTNFMKLWSVTNTAGR